MLPLNVHVLNYQSLIFGSILAFFKYSPFALNCTFPLRPTYPEYLLKMHSSKFYDFHYCSIVKGFPPVSPFIGVSPTLCYLLKEKKPLCCLQLAQICEHCSYRNAREYQWQNKTIILAADYASNGIYNFIIPLRAHFRSKTSLNPIILLLERRPDIAFLDSISYFPLVYWMLGTIDW